MGSIIVIDFVNLLQTPCLTQLCLRSAPQQSVAAAMWWRQLCRQRSAPGAVRALVPGQEHPRGQVIAALGNCSPLISGDSAG